MSPPHPLAPLSASEFRLARDLVKQQHDADTVLYFRSIYLHEPPRDELAPFLAAEHAGDAGSAVRPPRMADVEYDIVAPTLHTYATAIVNLHAKKVVKQTSFGPTSQPYYTVSEFIQFQDACVESPLFQEAMSEFVLPEGFSVTIDPWPYGSAADGTVAPGRYMQGLVFARESSKGNPDSNHYAYPIPIIPVMEWYTKTVIRVDRLATGGGGPREGEGDEGDGEKPPRKLFHNSLPAEYVPELLDVPLREDLRPLNIIQPEGASFRVHPDNLVEWQKWRFRISFTPREGAVLHDLCYDNRPVLYRLSFSEMTVPYADPRPPFHRKQAFDVGDGGFGRAANNLELGCDCLGAIHYLSALLAGADGAPTPAGAVVCLHEQDNGILWKHTNFRTNRAVVARLRELVIQFVVTLANYEYVLAFKLDVAANVTIEARATGIMSVVAVDDGVRSSPYGNVVSPGVLAQNHQHVFAVRIDPAIDSHRPGDTRVVVEESVPCAVGAEANPHGNLYEVQRAVVGHASWFDAEPRRNRVFRIENPHRQNVMSGKNVGYKLVPSATQLLLADETSVAARRAPFATHHLWVTGYRDGELWAAGEFTNQSVDEDGGVGSMVRRGDWFEDGDRPNEAGGGRKSSPVLWSVFGLTHNPRVEDWPVMPVEIHQLHLRPADFFTANPALDVPSTRNHASVLVPCCGSENKHGASSPTAASRKGTSVQENPLNHLQGAGPDIDPQVAGAAVDVDNSRTGGPGGMGRRRSVTWLVGGLVNKITGSGNKK